MAQLISFELFAPYNQAAALIGSFSDWNPIPMERDDAGFFRVEQALEDGVHHYKFRVRSQSCFLEPDQWVEIIDPYAPEIDDGNQAAIARIKDGQRIIDTYVWQHDDAPLPADDELIIYELHVGDFSGGERDRHSRGQFQHLVEKLDYLCELGINAIELMPVNEFPGDASWGYNPRHFFAVESSYGKTRDFKAFVDECHGRGIRVLLDFVCNHSEAEAPLTQIDHDYWYRHEPSDPEQNWGPEFNYEHYDETYETFPARWFMGDVIRHWIQEYHIDGLRYDAAKQIDNYDFMHWIVNEAKQTAGKKPFYNIAERIPDSPKITNQDGPMDGCWQETFYGVVRECVYGDRVDLESLQDAIDPQRRGYLGVTNAVNYIANHDHEHSMVELAQQGILGEAAFKRIKLGAAILLTAVGIPMIWMGEEFGEYKEKTIEPAKLDWTLLDNNDNQALLDYYRGLIQLRRENGALRSSNIDFFHQDPERQVLAYSRWDEVGSRIAVLLNLSDQFHQNYTVESFPAAGLWHEWTRDYPVETEGDRLTLDLAEHEAKVFVWNP